MPSRCEQGRLSLCRHVYSLNIGCSGSWGPLHLFYPPSYLRRRPQNLYRDHRTTGTEAEPTTAKRSLPYDTDSAPRARIRARGVNSATAPPYDSMAPYLILRVRSRTGIVALLGAARRADVGYINPKKRADVRREGGFPIAVATGGRCRIFYLQVKYDSGSIHIKNRDADQLQ